ncbi:non-hydrolyzing UDP-N-acetylglucosamine 2-epimerase [Reichenbachiella ulvae]|uniref:UDP-N-acetylglucosamine 2-epimerase (Non-hydrolyzing) n=1 Tax=Reichenbachiella ulvae TaxID=2980104 RepID=A0ABT3CQG5_9BACT|nr:UDP-N-acetylglucosamine 2-epimerase (non-hydrolyzing) [Reichenbachiella ulvae]MCV9385710.1 UDP-N-acetylglucosamine 2-epimerase (non-hydrolyzing) [Reichenbachiella ulvae]
MHIVIIAGARPNFMKIAPIIREINARISKGENFSYDLVHTGQHYDKKMSDTFFEELQIPEPDINLQVGSGTHAQQTAQIMVKFEEFLLQKPETNLVLVVGDINSTVACSLVAKKLNHKVAHVEAGLRSYDLEMPEEINRMVTDSISDYFFTTTEDASKILLSEGKNSDNVHFVGNTMIDTLAYNLDKLTPPDFLEEKGIAPGEFFLLTLHRPSNVDSFDHLIDQLKSIDEFVKDKKVVFPIHPRTLNSLKERDHSFQNIELVEPQGYLNFIYLLKNSLAIITDSGGIQEESTFLKVPCLTLRLNTERPETITIGSNILIGNDMELLKKSIEQILAKQWKESKIPDKWDGKTAERIIDVLKSKF